ncbi:MAG: hypothetical protein HKL80_06125 [Acidimicrobiales bacterium]|nr:hypothetical protein [Acidimicrobiales bacterium]
MDADLGPKDEAIELLERAIEILSDLTMSILRDAMESTRFKANKDKTDESNDELLIRIDELKKEEKRISRAVRSIEKARSILTQSALEQ